MPNPCQTKFIHAKSMPDSCGMKFYSCFIHAVLHGMKFFQFHAPFNRPFFMPDPCHIHALFMPRNFMCSATCFDRQLYRSVFRSLISEKTKQNPRGFGGVNPRASHLGRGRERGKRDTNYCFASF